jgi:uncharacterized MnhB-related membrane protein
MIPELAAIDGLLVLALLVSGAWCLASRDLYQVVVLYVAFGLLLALAWARLAAPDLAIAEAMIGAGITGALLLDAVSAIRGSRGVLPPERGDA